MPLDMDPDIRAQWCAALRSGDYQQAAGTLRYGNTFCCLGVLCDLGVKAAVLPPPAHADRPGGDKFFAYGGQVNYLPKQVMNWAGLTDNNPTVHYDGELTWLTQLNDEDLNFAAIADVIDGCA